MSPCCSGTKMDSINYQSDWLIHQWLLYRPIIAHVMNSNPDTQLRTLNKNFGPQTCTDLMHGSILLITILLNPSPPPATPRTSPHLQARAVLSWGQGGGGEIKKYLLFDFVKYVLFLIRFTQWLRTSRLPIFKEKSRNLSESGWRGVTFQN